MDTGRDLVHVGENWMKATWEGYVLFLTIACRSTIV
jgi:hypothetical protein